MLTQNLKKARKLRSGQDINRGRWVSASSSGTMENFMYAVTDLSLTRPRLVHEWARSFLGLTSSSSSMSRKCPTPLNRTGLLGISYNTLKQIVPPRSVCHRRSVVVAQPESARRPSVLPVPLHAASKEQYHGRHGAGVAGAEVVAARPVG